MSGLRASQTIHVPYLVNSASLTIAISDAGQGMTTNLLHLTGGLAYGCHYLDLGGGDLAPTSYTTDALKVLNAKECLAQLASDHFANLPGHAQVFAVETSFPRRQSRTDIIDHAEAWLQSADDSFVRAHGVAPAVTVIDSIDAFHPLGAMAPVADIVSIMRALRLKWPLRAFVIAVPSALFRTDVDLLQALIAPADRVVRIDCARLTLLKSRFEAAGHIRQFEIVFPEPANGERSYPVLKYVADLTKPPRSAHEKVSAKAIFRKAAKLLRPSPAPAQTCEVEDLSDSAIQALSDSVLHAYARRDVPDLRVILELQARDDGEPLEIYDAEQLERVQQLYRLMFPGDECPDALLLLTLACMRQEDGSAAERLLKHEHERLSAVAH